MLQSQLSCTEKVFLSWFGFGGWGGWVFKTKTNKQNQKAKTHQTPTPHLSSLSPKVSNFALVCQLSYYFQMQ